MGIVRVLAAAGSVVIATQVVNAAPNVALPPHSIVDGQSIGDRGGAWWTWVSQMPTSGNSFDTDGALAHQNNNGPVFFVAGNFGGTTTRSFTVPAGTPLLFPLLTWSFVQYPVSLENDLVANFSAATPSLTATIDHVAVPDLVDHLETSGVFSMGLAQPNTFGPGFETAGFPGDPACSDFTPDLLCPAIATGYYIMLTLSPGYHNVTVGGSITWDLPVDPTYFPSGGEQEIDTLTINNILAIPESASLLFLLPGILALFVLRRKMQQVLCGAVLVLALTASSTRATTVLPAGSFVDGKSIAEWTEGWWTRYWQYPPSLIDPATQNIGADFNNSGPVFYVPTTNGDPSLGHVTIHFSVPVGRPILVPVLPFDDLEAASIDGYAPLADRKLAADLVVAGWLSSVDVGSLFASIDGTPIDPASHLEQTGYYTAGLTQPNTVAAAAGVAIGDDLFPNKAAGYWLMIEGLSLGPHTLDFGGSSAQFTPESNCCTDFAIGPFAVDVAAEIDVVPEPVSTLLMLPGLLAVLAFRGGRKNPPSTFV